MCATYDIFVTTEILSFMFEVLLRHIMGKVSLTEADKQRIPDFFVYKKFRKRQYVLQEGDVCRSIVFVSSGILKSFRVDEKGHERVSLFGWEGWWISDFNSFIHQEPAILNIDAIEESEVLLLSRDNYDRLTETVPVMDRYFRILYQNSLVTKDKRLISANGVTAEEKYSDLLRTMPDIVNRIPQHLLASYLGLAPETISRIKRKLL